jgi:methylmalonyl-CoA/ethylmalonyl-CoA epimerase
MERLAKAGRFAFPGVATILALGRSARENVGMRLVQIAQRADDLDRAADFYTVLLDCPPAARFDPPGLLFFDLDGVRLLIERNAPSSLIYLHVDNVHEALERLDGIAEVVTHPHVIFTHEDDTLGPAGHEEWHAFVRDTEGNTVGLISFQRP